MVAFSQRPLCYQVGILLLMMATVVFSVGMAVPWWARTYSEAGGEVIRHSGLWLGCSSSSTGNCKPIEAPDWFKTVQGLQCVALAGMLAACAYSAFVNCCLDNLSYSRAVEVLTGIAGSLGLVSCILYVVKTSHVLRQNKQIGYSWAFGMDIGACVLVVIIAIIIALSNSRHHNEPRLIIHTAEDGFEAYRPRPRGRNSRSKSRGARTEIALDRSPVRTRRLGATSEADPEMIALQDGYASSQEGQHQLLPCNGVSDLQPPGDAMAGIALCACSYWNGGNSPCSGSRRTVENVQPRPSSTGGNFSEHRYYHHHSPCAAPAAGQPSEQQHHHHQLCNPDQQQQQQQHHHDQLGVVCTLPDHKLRYQEQSHHRHHHHHHNHLSDHQAGKSEHSHPHHAHPLHHPQENHQSCQRIARSFAALGGDLSNLPNTVMDSCCRPSADNPLCGGRVFPATTHAYQHQCGQKNSDCECDLSLVPATATKARTKGPYTQLPMEDIQPAAVPERELPPLPPASAFPGEERNNIPPFSSCPSGCSCGVVPPFVAPSTECASQASVATANKNFARRYLTDLTNCSRVTATAPPLEDEETEDKDRGQEFSQTQYFMRSETVFIGERRGREQ